ncbi:hypothetical protein DL771_009652 [Monosporascus sp. 5C6A]|nr:hypothetical protein DL771_009652 [Monosporascus sp. 5C6A]
MEFNAPTSAQLAVLGINAHDSTLSFNLNSGTQRGTQREAFHSDGTEKYEWLRSLGFCNVDARLRDISSAHPNTCDWFFKTSQFQQWRDRTHISSHNGVLWVKGKPGVGKSTLMKHTLDHCREIFKDHLIAAYFFNARGDRLEKTPLVLLLIDALDECNRPDVEKVVNFLESLSVNAINTKVSLNICLSSRHYPDVNMEKTLELVMEETEEHHGDIAKYVKSSLKGGDKDIEDGVIKKASDVFMWVVLVVAMLNRADNREAMQKTLCEVPGDLEDVFQTLLNENNSDKPETILMLQWVLFARRPLKPEELYFAVIAGTATGKLAAWNRSKTTSNDIRRRITSASRGLIECLHQRHEDFERLRRFHNAFEPYPALGCDKGVTPLYTLSFHGCYELVKILLLEKGADVNARGGPCGNALQAASIRGNENIVTMLLEKGADVNAQAGLYGSALQAASVRGNENIVTMLLENWANVNAQGGLYGTALQAALLHWNGKIVAMLLGMGADVNAQGGPYGNAIQAAVLRRPLWAFGKDGTPDEMTLAILLGRGADTNAQGGPYGNAIQAAVLKPSSDYHNKQQKERIVAMLLEKGANVNAQDGPYGSALQAASVGCNTQIVAMLLENGADVNAQGGSYGNALQIALFCWNQEVVAMLLEKGANINVQSKLYGNESQAALFCGNGGIMALKGVNVNAQGGPYDHALQAAVLITPLGHSGSQDKERIVAMLLEKGADVNAQGGPYGNALQAAVLIPPSVYEGNQHKERIVAMLLENGADVNAQGGPYGNALQAAVLIPPSGYKGNQYKGRIVAMLLEKGADVNAQGGPYGSALQAALVDRNEEVMAMLLEKGVDINDN